MRILHTSDWHLGRHFHGQGMLAHQAAYADHLIDTVESEQVDLVVVSGDVYDRALPPVDAVELADDTFARLAASRARVVMTSGNHDSARRLGFNARLVDAAGFHLRTVADAVDTPVVVEDAHGPVAVYGIPYLEPDLLRSAWALPARSHQAAMSEAARRIRADLDGRAPGTRSVVLAHAFVTGGQACDSERDISVGGVSMVTASVFEGFDYVALGHLHGRQTITESVRYSGSPLAYSFSESDHLKGSWLVDLDRRGEVRAEFIEAPVPRRLARLTGTLETLLNDRRHAEAEDAWVQATITDALRPTQAMARLQERFPHAVALVFAPEGGSPERPPVTLEGRSDQAIVTDFVAAVRGTPATAAEAALLQDACDACAKDAEADTIVVAG
ncbi:MAG TPA: exonuclease SbcCD subunit D [Marmoricola sp.]|nr:exonuclease SbcCD subunit D [Marmoricola sp.]